MLLIFRRLLKLKPIVGLIFLFTISVNTTLLVNAINAIPYIIQTNTLLHYPTFKFNN